MTAPAAQETSQAPGTANPPPEGGNAASGSAPSPDDSSTGNGTDALRPPETAPAAPVARRNPWDGRCGARTRSGGRCRVAATLCPDCGRCWAHCDHRKDEARARRQAGAKASAAAAAKRRTARTWPLPNERRPESAADCLVLSGWAAREVALGRMDPEVARTVKALCDTALRAVKESALAERLKALEQKLARLREQQHHSNPEGK